MFFAIYFSILYIRRQVFTHIEFTRNALGSREGYASFAVRLLPLLKIFCFHPLTYLFFQLQIGPPPPVVSASVSGLRRVETGDFETPHQQEWRRPLGKLPAGPLARRRLGGGQGFHAPRTGRQNRPRGM